MPPKSRGQMIERKIEALEDMATRVTNCPCQHFAGLVMVSGMSLGALTWMLRQN